jgi:hypothetical protein
VTGIPQPRLGAQVFVVVDPDLNNWADHAVAFITGLNGPSFIHGVPQVALRVLYNGPPDPQVRPEWLESSLLFESRDALEAHFGQHPALDKRGASYWE